MLEKRKKERNERMPEKQHTGWGELLRDALPANAAGADAACEGTLARARRETVASPHPRSDTQEAAGRSLPARLGGKSILPKRERKKFGKHRALYLAD